MIKKRLESKKIFKLKKLDLCNDLNGPACTPDINKLEAVINASLPEEFIQCLRNHNGQKGRAAGLFNGMQFLSCQSITTEWLIWKQLFDSNEFINHIVISDSGVAKTWWHPMWIPFTADGFGNHLCIDLAPEDGGKSGQIISLFHDDPLRKIQADSFADWFATQI